ncbi:MAG: hypothetical protein FWE83_02975 [Oscillospiraceae bacterium]|nr:hypothetical protein [Oscillospiraceae bacterium]
MKSTYKKRIFWAVGTVIALCLCFILCRFTFIESHGSYQYPVLLLVVGIVTVILAAIFDGRKVMISTVVGYIGGFALGIIFNVDGVDQGGGATNNWWIIWTISFIALIAAGVIWEVISKCISNKKRV